MKLVEATLAFFVFIIFLNSVLARSNPSQTNESLYRYELANDIWRVLYLRGDFHDFNSSTLNYARDKTENDLTKITELSGLCITIEGIRVQSKQCRGVSSEAKTVVITKKLLVGDEVKEVTMTVSASIQT